MPYKAPFQLNLATLADTYHHRLAYAAGVKLDIVITIALGNQSSTRFRVSLGDKQWNFETIEIAVLFFNRLQLDGVDEVSNASAEGPMQIKCISLEQFIEDRSARESAEAWYYNGSLVHMYYSDPYILVKGEAQEIPSGAILQDW